MRIAVYNVENLFRRAKAMNLDTWAEGKPILDEYARVNKLIQKPAYNASDKAAILDSLTKLGLRKSDEAKFAILRQNRGKLIKRPGGNAAPVIVASGRADWIGWVELKTEAVNETATRMTAKVIQDVNADVVAVVEAEDRVGLVRFGEQLLKPIGASYAGTMLIDGNDERGIDVGIFVRAGLEITSICSHVDDADVGNGSSRIFSRDCAEYTIRTPGGTKLLILVNHFKSKGFGSQASSNARRKSQAKRVREIYDTRRNEGVDHVAIVGDFNDTPGSDPLSPLFDNNSDLQDIFDHPNFAGDGRPGTYANGAAGNKIDYILLSPALQNAVTTCGIERRGVWGGASGTLFPHYPEMERAEHAASDHAALWADVNL